MRFAQIQEVICLSFASKYSMDNLSFPVNMFFADASRNNSSRSLYYWYCPSCEINIDTPVPESNRLNSRRHLCNVCGTLCTLRNSTIASIDSGNQSGSFEDQWAHIIDLLGMRELVQTATSLRAPNRTLSESYLKNITRCSVDSNYSILWDANLRLGPVQIMLIPAAFCSRSLTPRSINLAMAKGNPEFGERYLENAEFVRGRVLLLYRGKTTFANKFKLAIQSGAAALLVSQTLDVWPFVMTDSTDELSLGSSNETTPTMPCFMISKVRIVFAIGFGLRSLMHCSHSLLYV